MNDEHDFFPVPQTQSSTAINSHATFVPTCYKSRFPGLFLAMVDHRPPAPLFNGDENTVYNRYKYLQNLVLKVKNAAGTLLSNCIFPPAVKFETSSLHTHTTSDGPTTGTASWVSNVDQSRPCDHQQFLTFVEFQSPDDIFISCADAIPDANCGVQLIRLAPCYWNTTKAAI